MLDAPRRRHNAWPPLSHTPSTHYCPRTPLHTRLLRHATRRANGMISITRVKSWGGGEQERVQLLEEKLVEAEVMGDDAVSGRQVRIWMDGA
jgi:hypothetical protein